jgi:hypothetical protein
MQTVCVSFEDRFPIRMRNNADTADVVKKAFCLRPGTLLSCAWLVDLDASDIVTNGGGINSTAYAGWAGVYDSYRVVACSARVVYRHNNLENEGMLHIGVSSAISNADSYVATGGVLVPSTMFLAKSSSPVHEERHLVMRPRDVSHREYRLVTASVASLATDWGTYTILLDGCKTGATVIEVILNRTFELAPKVGVTAGAAGDEESADYAVLQAASEAFAKLPHGVASTGHDPGPSLIANMKQSLGQAKFDRNAAMKGFSNFGSMAGGAYKAARFAGRMADATDWVLS